MDLSMWPRVYYCNRCGTKSNASVHCFGRDETAQTRKEVIHMPGEVTATCVVCGKTATQPEEKFWDDGWLPLVKIDGVEKGPVCPDHAIEEDTEGYLTLRKEDANGTDIRL